MLHIFTKHKQNVVQTVYNTGYFFGGRNTPTVYNNLIHKFLFDTKTCTNLGVSLSASRYAITGLSSPSNGYACCGYNGNPQRIVDRVSFSTDALTLLSSSLSVASYTAAGLCTEFKGYSCGGIISSVPSLKVERLVFSTEASSQLSTTLVTATRSITGISSKKYNRGYLPGGWSSASATDSKIESQNNTTEVFEKLSVSLSLGRMANICVSSSEKGYVCGGSLTGATAKAVIDAITLSTNTRSVLASTLKSSRYAGAGSSAVDVGYIASGSNYGDSGTYLASIDSVNFTTEETAIISAALTTACFAAASVSGIYQ